MAKSATGDNLNIGSKTLSKMENIAPEDVKRERPSVTGSKYSSPFKKKKSASAKSIAGGSKETLTKVKNSPKPEDSVKVRDLNATKADEMKYKSIDTKAEAEAKADKIKQRAVTAASNINTKGVAEATKSVGIKAAMEVEDKAILAAEAAAKAAALATGGAVNDVPFKQQRIRNRYGAVINVLNAAFENCKQFERGNVAAKMVCVSVSDLKRALEVEQTTAISMNSAPETPLVFPPRTQVMFLNKIMDDFTEFAKLSRESNTRFHEVIGAMAPMYIALCPTMAKQFATSTKASMISMSDAERAVKVDPVLKESDTQRIKDFADKFTGGTLKDMEKDSK